MNTETIPSGQAAYAGEETTVRSQVETAIAEGAPLPQWKLTVKTEQPNAVRTLQIKLSTRLLVYADSHGGEWLSSIFASLDGRYGPCVTEAMKLALLREAKAELDAARPVLDRLIAAAEAALGLVVIDDETS